MSLRAFICELTALAVLLPTPAFAADDGERLSQDEINRRYDRLIEEEKARTSPENFTERLASGIAALGIGLYGYYNDDRGILTKLVYSATQTAGVVMVSNAILDANQPSLLLMTDRYLSRRKQMDLERFRRGIVLVEQKRTMGEYKQLAYTSGILATIYAYDAYREKSEEGLKNIFYFLTFNFTLISAANFYRLAAHDYPTQMADNDTIHWEISALPIPTVTVYF